MSQAQAFQQQTVEPRKFRVGTAGWTVADLDDPRYNKLWEVEHVELVNGIVVEMPPAFYGGSSASGRLLRILFQSAEFRDGLWMSELDLQVGEDTVFRPDFTWMSKLDDAAHRAEVQCAGRNLAESRLSIPPSLLVESISQGHERHDRALKFERYASFGVRNYWIIDGFAKRLDCYKLNESRFVIDAVGKDIDLLKPSLFAPLVISLAELWPEDDKRQH